MGSIFLFAFIINLQPKLEVLPIIPFDSMEQCVEVLKLVPQSPLQHKFVCVELEASGDLKKRPT